MELCERIKVVRGFFSQEEFAGKVGVHKNTAARWERGERCPDAQDLFKITIAFPEFAPEWLLTGEGSMRRGEGTERETAGPLAVVGQEPPEGYIRVPRYDIAASAGGGAMVHSEQVVDYLAFRKEWLQGSLGVSPSSVAVISVMGDSMEPYLADGDLILVDTSVTRIENNAVYVIHVDGSLLVKRIQKKIDGTVIVKSDNEHYEPEVFRGEATELLRVVGKMVRRLVR